MVTLSTITGQTLIQADSDPGNSQVELIQTLGSYPGIVQLVPQPVLVDTGPAIPNFSTIDPEYYSVSLGGNSYEVYMRFFFDDGDGTINNIKLYRTSSLPTGVSLKMKGVWTTNTPSTYLTPVLTTSSLATTDIPSSGTGAVNVSINNSSSGTGSGPFYSDYIILQLQASTTATQGAFSIDMELAYQQNGYVKLVPFSILSAVSTDSELITNSINVSGIYTDPINITGVYR